MKSEQKLRGQLAGFNLIVVLGIDTWYYHGYIIVVLPRKGGSMANNANEDRTARYRDRMKAEGLKKVCVWVPEKETESVKAYAARLRKKAGK